MSYSTSNPEALSISPCAACKLHRKKCTDKCVLGPYFPRNDPDKFLLVHTVFGNSNIIKLLQVLPVQQRGEAVKSMVYEARERVRDPVHGCAGVINELHRKVAELESQLASAEAAVLNMSAAVANMSAHILTGCQDRLDPNVYSASLHDTEDAYTSLPVLDDEWEPILNLVQLWKP